VFEHSITDVQDKLDYRSFEGAVTCFENNPSFRRKPIGMMLVCIDIFLRPYCGLAGGRMASVFVEFIISNSEISSIINSWSKPSLFIGEPLFDPPLSLSLCWR
jgi:hypothetical protein